MYRGGNYFEPGLYHATHRLGEREGVSQDLPIANYFFVKAGF